MSSGQGQGQGQRSEKAKKAGGAVFAAFG